jgi:predicted transcriptional regulator
MKVIVNISEDDLTKIKKALISKRYTSISEFVTLAIHNQLSLEGDILKIPNLESLISQEQEKLPDIIKKDIEHKIGSHKIETVPSNEVQDFFPFWGTQNKYLCLKQITTDFLHLASREEKNWIRYDVTMNYLIKRAIEIRRRFESIDKLLHRPRGDKYQTGFPLEDSKSISRYEKQYIGGIDTNNKVYGMALEMGLLSIRRNKETDKLEFGITKEGKDFANIESPILYKKTSNISPTTPHLSDGEVDLIISILKKRKSKEVELMKYTLEYISQGKNQPDDGKAQTKDFLDKSYPEISQNKKGGSYSIIEANTMRAGIISRLAELGFIKIIKKGIKSEYKVTDKGFNFLSKKEV